MNKIKKSSHTYISVFSSGMIIAIFAFSFFGIQSAHALITSQLDIYDKGSQVTEAQTYLAKDVAIYPEGLITGYFGQLTKAAVERFQTSEGIVSQGTPATTGYGRIGPKTIIKLNSIFGPGTNTTSWDHAPILSDPTTQTTNTSATFTWTTNEPTRGEVYWSDTPLQLGETTASQQQPYISGTLATDAGNLQTNHAVTVSNLQTNNTYYYTVKGTDNVGNVSLIWPRVFQTKQ